MKPLADSMRPQELSEVAGQRELCGEDGILTRVLASGTIPNMIFYGPPGVGKTTVAGILAKKTDKKLYRLNGTTAGTGDIKEIVSELGTMLAPNGVLLYLDEIQYLNKKQQQSLLEFIENGEITLIASTTENPFFYVYPAIISRSTVFEFKNLEAADVLPVIGRAISEMERRYETRFLLSDEIRDYIASGCGGDVRKSINMVEMLCLTALPRAKDGEAAVSEADCEVVLRRGAVRHDRDGDSHYDLLSAFQKSIRGSDPDAAVYYLAKLLAGGDLASVCRRLLVVASEDIGLAYPQAVAIVNACVESAFRLGMPEARIPLAEGVVLLATAPKSNTSYMAINRAMADIESGASYDVPSHLKDTSYRGAKTLGRGGYIYPHEYENDYIPQQYLPDELVGTHYYEFGENKLESASRRYWEEIKAHRSRKKKS